MQLTNSIPYCVDSDDSEPLHAPGTLEETLPPEKHLGPVDPTTVVKVREDTDDRQEGEGIPPIRRVIGIDDFEVPPIQVSLILENHTENRNREDMDLLLLRCRRSTLYPLPLSPMALSK